MARENLPTEYLLKEEEIPKYNYILSTSHKLSLAKIADIFLLIS